MTLILIYVVVFGALMMFMTTRGRRKQASQAQLMQQALMVGAEVRTIGGIVGTVIDLTDEYVVVETTPGVKLKFTKQAIAGVVQPDQLEQETPEYGEELTPVEGLTPAEEEAAAQETGETEPEDAVDADSADAKDQQKVG